MSFVKPGFNVLAGTRFGPKLPPQEKRGTPRIAAKVAAKAAEKVEAAPAPKPRRRDRKKK